MTLAYGGEHMRRPEAPSVPPAVVVPAERGPHEAVDVDAVVVVVHVVPGDQHGDVRGTADQDGRGPQVRVVLGGREQADHVADGVVPADVVVQDLVAVHVQPWLVAVDGHPGDAVAGDAVAVAGEVPGDDVVVRHSKAPLCVHSVYS